MRILALVSCIQAHDGPWLLPRGTEMGAKVHPEPDGDETLTLHLAYDDRNDVVILRGGLNLVAMRECKKYKVVKQTSKQQGGTPTTVEIVLNGKAPGKVGTLTILISGTQSGVVSSPILSDAVGLLFVCPATFTGAITVLGHPEQDTAFASCKALKIEATDLTLTAARQSEWNIAGIRTVAIQSGSAEGAQRDVQVYAILDI